MLLALKVVSLQPTQEIRAVFLWVVDKLKIE